jgi:DedD protein
MVQRTMSSRVRDLEQLQEDDDGERRRKRGTLALAAFAILALAFAIGIVVGKAVLPAAPERDPFDQLDRVAEASRLERPAAAPQPTAANPVVEVTDLSFERALTSGEERPEVLAALAEAAREEETLAVNTAARAPSAAVPEPDDDLEADDFKPPVVPAGAGAATGSWKRSKQQGKLIAAQARETGTPAARGSEGEYTLQVISYDSQAAAEAFANALRARGHAAFVTTGDVEGRGRYYRVRLGPFPNRLRAEEYRQDFEQREHMNTIVVKKPDHAG